MILEAKTRPGANDRIDDAECIKLIQKLAKQGKESAEIYRQQGREDLYEQESGQVAGVNTVFVICSGFPLKQ